MAIMRIKELRKQAGITQERLAEDVGVTQSIASDWEREVYLPRAIQLPLLAKSLSVSINELYDPDYLASVS